MSWSTRCLGLRPVLSGRIWTDKTPISLPFDMSPIHRDGRGMNTFENVFTCICVHTDLQGGRR